MGLNDCLNIQQILGAMGPRMITETTLRAELRALPSIKKKIEELLPDLDPALRNLVVNAVEDRMDLYVLALAGVRAIMTTIAKGANKALEELRDRRRSRAQWSQVRDETFKELERLRCKVGYMERRLRSQQYVSSVDYQATIKELRRANADLKRQMARYHKVVDDLQAECDALRRQTLEYMSCMVEFYSKDVLHGMDTVYEDPCSWCPNACRGLEDVGWPS